MASETAGAVSTSSAAATAKGEPAIPTTAAPIDLSPVDRRPGWRTVARIAFGAAAWLLVAGLIVQVFLAGLGVFDSPERFELHASFGFTLMALPLILVLSGLAGGVERRLVGLAGLMFGLFFVQSILVSLRGQAPTIAALHPVNGFLILFVSIVVARGSLAVRRPASAHAEVAS
jgi:Family of unknown function (DUF6220)